MNNVHLPPLPPPDATGSDVCNIVRLYLAVWDDLSSEQARVVSAHVKSCSGCAQEQFLLGHSTQLVANLATSEPASHVDQAVLAAIAARTHQHSTLPVRRLVQRRRFQFRSPLHLSVGLAAAAVVLLVVLASALLLSGQQPPQGFAVPSQLSWNAYVLYHKETMSGSQGEHYVVMSYDNMSDRSMNVETLMDGRLDVVAVKDQQKALGMDMMHHVAQWGAEAWCGDDTLFDLDRLRNDLQTHRAVYLGKSRFNGQEVYRVRVANGDILLLNLQYMPVNVLAHSSAGNGEKPLYDTLQWLSPSHVSDTMWSMQVPPDFTMGQLPPKP